MELSNFPVSDGDHFVLYYKNLLLNMPYTPSQRGNYHHSMFRNATSNDRCPLYVLGAPSHFPTEYRQEVAVVSREQDGYLGRWLSMTTTMGV